VVRLYGALPTAYIEHCARALLMTLHMFDSAPLLADAYEFSQHDELRADCVLKGTSCVYLKLNNTIVTQDRIEVMIADSSK
jgi:hypothetical protein